MTRWIPAFSLLLVAVTACDSARFPEDGDVVEMGTADSSLVYGADNIIEYYDADAHPLVSLFDAGVALLDSSALSLTVPGDPSGGYDIDFTADGTYEEYMLSIGMPLCPLAEPTRRDQPVPGFCSGFVVGEDLIVTAGHCIETNTDCDNTSFVFGFVMTDADTPVSHVGPNDVYTCSQIISRIDDGSNDYALVRTDRTIVGHTMLPVRRSGAVEDLPNDAGELTVIGHPMGMPAKIADGATTQGGTADYFTSNVDVYGGNSGSAVVNEQGVVEGILVRGNPDHLWSDGCYVLNWCPDTGCTGFSGSGFEEITRITNLSDLIPSPCGDGTCDPGQNCINCPADCGVCETEDALFFDDFADGLTQWSETGEGDWNTESLHSTTGYPSSASGAPAAHSDDCDTGCAIEIAVPIDLTPYDSALLTFLRFVDVSLDAGEYLTVRAWNGSGWDLLFTWTDSDGDTNSWYEVSVDLTPYVDVSDFVIVFETMSNRTAEHVQVDDVRIVAATLGARCRTDDQCDDGLFCNGAETCGDDNLCHSGTAPTEDDGVGCTDESCNEVTDSIDHTPNDANCDDNLFCTGKELCDVSLDCQPGTAPDVDDGVGCTDDSCNEETDEVDHVLNHDSCDNGVFCDGVEMCDAALDCQPGEALVLEDGVDCTDDSCNEETDSIDHVPNHDSCDNGQFCDGEEVCDITLDCQSGPSPTEDDGVGCTYAVCNEETDEVDHIANNENCDDGLFCNGAETCDATLDCQDGVAPTADDGITCTDAVCNDSNDSFDHVPNNENCDDGLFCNGAETCDATLDCVRGLSPAVSDGVDCTDDSCNEETDTIDHVPNHPSCSNGLFCDGIEVCDATLDCQSGALPVVSDGVDCTDDSCNEDTDSIDHITDDDFCDDGLFCNGAETCHMTLDCQPGTAPTADDGVDCTDSACVESTDSFEHIPNDAHCDDDLFCNGTETCDATLDCQIGEAPTEDDGVSCTDAACVESTDSFEHIPNNEHCNDNLFCNGVETCDATLDCQSGAPPTVDDGIGCTDDNCDEDSDSVVHIPVDSNCNNGLFCDGMETCDATLDCQPGTPPSIDDGVSCTEDSCDEATDSSDHVPIDRFCSNGLFCDGAEICDPVLDCVPGAAPTGDDGVTCTDDVCNEDADAFDHVANDDHCDNDLFCDGAETCDAILDCQLGEAPISDDNVDCTDDVCNEDTDSIEHLVNHSLCDNALFCDGIETCDAELDCQDGTPPDIDDGVTCTDDSCDEDIDSVVHLANDFRCDNGMFCDGVEFCDVELDCQLGTPPTIDDGVYCTDDYCDEEVNSVVHEPNDWLCSNGQFCDGLETCDAELDCQAGVALAGSDPDVCSDGEADVVLSAERDEYELEPVPATGCSIVHSKRQNGASLFVFLVGLVWLSRHRSIRR